MIAVIKQIFITFRRANKMQKNRIRIINNISLKIKNFIEEESGMGVVEVILITLVLVGLAFVFKTQITSIAQSIFKAIKLQVQKF